MKGILKRIQDYKTGVRVVLNALRSLGSLNSSATGKPEDDSREKTPPGLTLVKVADVVVRMCYLSHMVSHMLMAHFYILKESGANLPTNFDELESQVHAMHKLAASLIPDHDDSDAPYPVPAGAQAVVDTAGGGSIH